MKWDRRIACLQYVRKYQKIFVPVKKKTNKNICLEQQISYTYMCAALHNL
jgi:hypothetical protein